jgi:phosphate starvation-inducible PhoH-like protein
MAKRNGRHGKDSRRKKKFTIDYLSEDGVVINLPSCEDGPSGKAGKRRQKRQICAKNQAQGQFLSAIEKHSLIFGLGPAGTGKSYCTAAMAAESLENEESRYIVFTRPAVETGNGLGFLPGKLSDKFDPFFSAFKACLVQHMGRGAVECALKNGKIIVEPLSHLRGKTLDDSFVIMEEAQNASIAEMKMFLTRIGRLSTVVINGDLKQMDILDASGLQDAVDRLHNVNGVYVHEFEHTDIVRSGLVKDIILRYEDNKPGWSFNQ